MKNLQIITPPDLVLIDGGSEDDGIIIIKCFEPRPLEALGS